MLKVLKKKKMTKTKFLQYCELILQMQSIITVAPFSFVIYLHMVLPSVKHGENDPNTDSFLEFFLVLIWTIFTQRKYLSLMISLFNIYVFLLSSRNWKGKVKTTFDHSKNFSPGVSLKIILDSFNWKSLWIAYF